MLGFELDIWDYRTFLAFFVLVVAGICAAIFVLGLPGRITVHLEAEAASIMGWVGFVAVVRWTQGFIWAFKPVNVVAIRYMLAEVRRETEREITHLPGKSLSTTGHSTQTRRGITSGGCSPAVIAGLLITVVYIGLIWLIFLRLRLLRFSPVWGIVSAFFRPPPAADLPDRHPLCRPWLQHCRSCSVHGPAYPPSAGAYSGGGSAGGTFCR
jgi:hypothetical protein